MTQKTNTTYTGRWGESAVDPLADIAAARDRMLDDRRVFIVGSDFSVIEQRILAEAISTGDPVFIDLRQSGGQIAGIFDIPCDIAPLKPIMKQNGRSAAYLTHDRSKQHKGRHRGR